jgi:hypothetical protein
MTLTGAIDAHVNRPNINLPKNEELNKTSTLQTVNPKAINPFSIHSIVRPQIKKL